MQFVDFKKSARWYTREGQPIASVPYADPKKEGQRDVTLADAKKLGLLPSVTTILNIKAKPSIQRWRENNLLLHALTIPKNIDEDDNQLAKRIVEDWETENAKAAILGTKVHNLIECYFLGKDLPNDVPNKEAYLHGLSNFQSRRQKQSETLTAKEIEKSFAHNEYGFAGKIDFIGTYEGKPAIVDFKTQSSEKTNIYREWLLQLTAYYYGAFNPKVDFYELVNIVVSTSKPGYFETVIWPREEIRKAWIAFQAAVELWKWENKF